MSSTTEFQIKVAMIMMKKLKAKKRILLKSHALTKTKNSLI